MVPESTRERVQRVMAELAAGELGKPAAPETPAPETPAPAAK
jgi:hypothetical protein